MQAAGRVGQLKRIVKSKKMGSTQQQLFVLFVVFLLSPVAPQVRTSSFFPSSALSVSNPSPSATYHCTTPARQYQTQKSTQSDFVSGTDMLHILNNWSCTEIPNRTCKTTCTRCNQQDRKLYLLLRFHELMGVQVVRALKPIPNSNLGVEEGDNSIGIIQVFLSLEPTSSSLVVAHGVACRRRTS